MTLTCEAVRDALADGEAPGADVDAHLAGCEACRAIAVALREVDGELESLAPIPASDALVARTIARIDEEAARLDEEGARPSGIAARSMPSELDASAQPASSPASEAPGANSEGAPVEVGIGALFVAALAVALAALTALVTAPYVALRALAGWLGDATPKAQTKGRATGPTKRSTTTAAAATERRARGPWLELGVLASLVGVVAFGTWQRFGSMVKGKIDGSTNTLDAMPTDGAYGYDGPADVRQGFLGSRAAGEARRPMGQAVDGVPAAANGELALDQTVAPSEELLRGGALRDELNDRGDLGLQSPSTDATGTEGLVFQARDGWWLNTYVPGDPAIRLVRARLSDDLALLGTSRTALALANDARPLTPPLDAPLDHALAIGAFADTAAIDGPTRVRVEVALRSVAQAAGRRGPLRVAVVLDRDATETLDADVEAHARALVMALSQEVSLRDQLALFASGPDGGELAPLGSLAGRLEVALRRAFATSDAAPVALTDAVTQALEAVSGAEGVGLVLVVTPGDVPDAGALDRALQLGAAAGITTSAVGLGARAPVEALDRIALAGRGRRRVVLSDDDARAAVRAELQAASELVARAVRVRVRLAEGVELVDILGSRPLDAVESERTRAAEQAVDRELAARLGILSDRDEDAHGLRMLIPAFYANDAHSIVLDLLVTRPGPVLDVDVALKDLVRLDNAHASTSLSLPHGASPRGPRELRVLADVLVHETALALTRAADALDRGALGEARQAIADVLALSESFRASEPRLELAPSFQEDRALLVTFSAALQVPTPSRSLRDSLSYAASRRLLRPRLATSE